MNDLIFRHNALCALTNMGPMNRDLISRFDAVQKIKHLSAIETIDGYSLDWLVYVATISKEKGIAPQDAVEIVKNASLFMENVRKKQDELLDTALGKLLDGTI